MSRKRILILALAVALPLLSLAQSPSLATLNAERLQTARIGMYTLGGWALVNLAVGGVGWANTTGSTQAFHQMNALWNVVNLGLAAGSYYGMVGDDPAAWSAWESLQHQLTLERAFLFNTALDLAYVAGGFYLRERARRNTLRADRWRGWGNSLLLQGSFLFAFDLTLYLLVHPGLAQLQPYLTQVAVAPTGFAITIPLGR